MSSDRYYRFAVSVAKHLLGQESAFMRDSEQSEVVHMHGSDDTLFSLDMTPFAAEAAEVSALPFFDDVSGVSKLLSAYQSAKQSLTFENDLPDAKRHLSDYADDFLTALLARANAALTDQQARTIADWVKHLDIYCAVKCVESFLYSQADLKLLEIAPRYGWDVIFDHMAIRCGSQEHDDAERVANLLKKKHGYVSTQFSGEAYYQFPDGWNAYPVYKILNNGQVLRIFVDQSDADAPSQIIQHWNRVYGYTAHHVGIRATQLKAGIRTAVPLEDVMRALVQEGIDVLTPTGHYTRGLLLQVFTRPERNSAIPAALKAEIIAHGAQLEKTIENAKLLELVSRRELMPPQAEAYFALYGLTYDPSNPHHSAPVYQYFLPAQAAHVIKTSQHIAG
ncbi:hypothetical protein Tel_14475 [Candidatus Tenderia electrophaga]|jgi:hypothetical protein|uniref:Uncharacterized protein n=1 Tax=Candidatus Tenderia electrophaga TaxID=1748243 RepID=A0A0S2TGG7_9GAMM|nr:hypothetical protein Tel_14475 [Candidatus Tenderia electrophaga]